MKKGPGLKQSTVTTRLAVGQEFLRHKVALLFFLGSPSCLLCLPTESEAAVRPTCRSAFYATEAGSSNADRKPHLDEQAHQFVQLLIDSQSKDISPSQRQARLADAQRVFSELTEAQPEIADLIQEEWRKLHSRSESAIVSRRAKVLSEIETVQQELALIRAQTTGMLEWMLLDDTAADPTVKATLETELNDKSDILSQASILRIRNHRYIEANIKGATRDIDTKRSVAHQVGVRSAWLLPDGRVLSWSAQGLVVWRYREGFLRSGYRVDQQFGIGKEWSSLSGHTDAIVGVDLFPDGRVLSWSNDHTLIIWTNMDGEFRIEQRLGTEMPAHHYDGKLIHRYRGHGDSVAGAQVLPDMRILSWSNDRTLILWKQTDGIYSREHRLGSPVIKDPKFGHVTSVLKARMVSDRRIVSLDAGDRILLWELGLPDALRTRADQLTEKLKALREEFGSLEAAKLSISHSWPADS